MTLLERLQAHKGGLIKLETELYWYGGRGWDGNPGRVCLLLDAAAALTAATVAAAEVSAADAAVVSAAAAAGDYRTATALLLIDGSPHWVWMSAENVELL